MSLYEPLSRYRRQWLVVKTSDGTCHHGIVVTVTRDFLELQELDEDNEPGTIFIDMKTIHQLKTDCKALQKTRFEASWDFGDDPENKAKVAV